ncbi:MAG: quinone-dependent dihydroorotate dehydrogenase [Bacteroidia bacterium]|nr:quinone-dependent dihydroorotate dehydrogenase [Bacteroidia bacterium]
MAYSVLKPFLFSLDAEKAHHLTINALKVIQQHPDFLKLIFKYSEYPQLKRKVFGLEFKNPLGLAAGLDKNAEVFGAFAAMGFGFVEVGTITPRPQEGNPKPRLFRLPKNQALLNRMGFNNVGAELAARNIEKIYHLKKCVLGINIGKNKDTPNEKAHLDYGKCIEYLHPFADYFVVNVSSPNTPGLRNLLDKEPLKIILETVQNSLAKNANRSIPVLLKISPDMDESVTDDIVEVCMEFRLSGIVATNTTLSRTGLDKYPKSYIDSLGSGGISGLPMKKLSNKWIEILKRKVPVGFALVGSGGIMNASDAKEKLNSGADLIQIYTGLIYRGPGLIHEILNSLHHE